jgi:hypothetical protein
MSINKFYPINVQNSNTISGTYKNVSLLVNADEEVKGNLFTKNTMINTGYDVSYALAVVGDVSFNGNLYVKGVQITGSGGGGGGTQDLASVLSYGNKASTFIDMSYNNIINVNMLDVSNGQSPVTITNWNISTPSYSGATNKYSQYTGTGTYSGLSGFIFSTSTTYGYNVSIQYGTGGADFITYFPFSVQQALSLQLVQFGNITMKSINYTLPAGHYKVSFQLYAQNIGSGGQIVNFTVVNNATSGILGQLSGLNPVNSFPNWVKYTTNFSLTDTTTIYFNWFLPGPTSYYYSYINFTGVQLTQYDGIRIHDPTTISIISSKSSSLNDVFIANGLNVTSGGASITGGLNSYSQYGGDNLVINSIAGSISGSNNNSCIAIGQATLQASTGSNRTIAIGSGGSPGSTVLTDCISVGTNINYNNSASRNVAIGNYIRCSGTQNVLLGYSQDYGNFGQTATSDNVVVGYNVMNGRYNGFGVLQSYRNVAIGTNALYNAQDTNNVACGYQSLYNLVGSNGVVANENNGYYTANNTAIGMQSGLTPTRANGCTFLGAYTDVASGVNNITNSTAIGYNAKIRQSNTVVIGATTNEAVRIYGDLSGVTTVNGLPYSTNTDLGAVLTQGNVASTSINMNNYNLRNVIFTYTKNISNTLGVDTKFHVSVDMSGNNLNNVGTINGVTDVNFGTNINMGTNSINNLGTLNVTTIDNPTTNVAFGTGINMTTHNINNVLTLNAQTVNATTSTVTTLNATTIDNPTTNVAFGTGINMASHSINNVLTLNAQDVNATTVYATTIDNTTTNVAFGTGINMASHNINNVLTLNSGNVNATTAMTTPAIGINNAIVSGKALYVTGNTYLNGGRTDVIGSLYLNGSPITGGGGGSQTLAQTLTLGNQANLNIDMSENSLQRVGAISMVATTGALNMNSSNINSVNSITMSGAKNIDMQAGTITNAYSVTSQLLNQTQNNIVEPDIKLENVNSSATTGVRMRTTKLRPAAGLSAGDTLYQLETYGTNASNASVQYANDEIDTVVTTAGLHEAKRTISTAQAGSMTTVMELGSNITAFRPIILSTIGIQNAQKSIIMTANASYSSQWANYCGNHTFVSQTTNGWTLTIGSAVTYAGGICAIENISAFDLTLTSGGGNFAGSYGNGTTSYTVYSGQIMRFVSNGTNWIVNKIDGVPMTVRYVNTASNAMGTAGTTLPFPTLQTTSISSTSGIRTWSATNLGYASGVFTNNSGFPMTLLVQFTGVALSAANHRFIGVNYLNTTRNPYSRPMWVNFAAGGTATMSINQTVHLGTGDTFSILAQVFVAATTINANSNLTITRIN